MQPRCKALPPFILPSAIQLERCHQMFSIGGCAPPSKRSWIGEAQHVRKNLDAAIRVFSSRSFSAVIRRYCTRHVVSAFLRTSIHKASSRSGSAPFVDSPNCALQVSMPREHYANGGRRNSADARQELNSIHIRHPHVRHHDGVSTVLRNRRRLPERRQPCRAGIPCAVLSLPL